MTIQDAIKALDAIALKHGADVQVYFDCPQCARSFTPNLAAPKFEKRVVVTAPPPPGDTR